MVKTKFALWLMLALCATCGCSKKAAAPPASGTANADASAADQDPDYKNIQGQWKIVSSEWDGEPNEQAVGNLFTFDGRNLQAWVRDIGTITLNYELDPTKQPKHLTARRGSGPKESIYTAIYELDGDTLKLCFRERDRPTSFKTTVGSFWTSHVLQRTDGTE